MYISRKCILPRLAAGHVHRLTLVICAALSFYHGPARRCFGTRKEGGVRAYVRLCTPDFPFHARDAHLLAGLLVVVEPFVFA
jgi:hypothetical protein